MLQMDEQGQLDANRAAFERQRDFAMNQYGSFGNILGGHQASAKFHQIRANPYTAALSGGMMGAGFGGNIMDYFFSNRQRRTRTPGSWGIWLWFQAQHRGFGFQRIN